MKALLERQYQERSALKEQLEAEERAADEVELAALPPARRKAYEIVERLCSDPEMWGTHGIPPEHKLQRLKDEFEAALTQASAPPVGPIEAVAEAWASIDGKLQEFHAEKAMPLDDPRRKRGGRYDGYMIEAEELLKRVRARGYVLTQAPAAAGGRER